MGFTKKKSIRRIFKRKQSTKKRGNRTRRHVRSAAIFRRRRTMRGGATSDAKAREEGLRMINKIQELYYLDPQQKVDTVNNALTQIKLALDNTGLGAMGQMRAIRNAILSVAPPPPQASALASTPPSGAAGGTTRYNIMGRPISSSSYVPRHHTPPTPFATERHSAAGGGAVAAGPAIVQYIKGAIIIVRDPTTGNILLGRESKYAVETEGERKRYISNHSGKGDTLANREYLSGELYKNIASEFSAAGGGGGLLVPLVEQSKSEKNTYGNPKYGSHPRIQRQGSTEYGAPKGGSKTHNGKLTGNIIENHLDTAQREFIEEVGHVFPDNRYQYSGIVNGYAVYLIDVTAAERTTIEATIATRYARHIGETFDLGFRDPRTVSLNAMTRDALSLI